jgi:hypothetical protein
MKKLSHFLYEKSTLAIALTITAIIVAFFVFGFLDAATCFEVEGGTIALGLSFGLPYDLVQDFFDARTPEMIECYINFNTTWDNVFPLLYGLLYAAWMSFIFKPFSNKTKLLNLLPFSQTLFDWGENINLVSIANSVLQNEAIPAETVQMASAFSYAKWVVSGFVFLAIGIGIIYRIKRMIDRKKSN